MYFWHETMLCLWEGNSIFHENTSGSKNWEKKEAGLELAEYKQLPNHHHLAATLTPELEKKKQIDMLHLFDP